MMQGKVQVYTGEGKGKTTAALGLALRAAGAGLQVFIGQFLKKGSFSELKSLERLQGVEVEQFGSGRFIGRTLSREDKEHAARGLVRIREVIGSGEYDLVVLDEINEALFFNLIAEAELLEIITRRPLHVELVLTGRNAPEEIIKRADLVTEMRKIRHYYDNGLAARVGIEK
jgi:cob(I)alamin adenosyltransferase